MCRAETLKCSKLLLERRKRSVKLRASPPSVVSTVATHKARIFGEGRHTAARSE
jgi:hypothetical protein